MPRFPSDAWMDEFCARLASQDGAADVAAALDGVYRFVIDPAGPLEERRVFDVEIRPEGDGLVARRTDDGDDDPRLTLTADYTRWQQLITGRLDIGMAIMLRRLRVQGDLQRLVRDVSSATPLMDALRDVETQWWGG
jgi:hypothetical protein